jgi:hypothetical protein
MIELSSKYPAACGGVLYYIRLLENFSLSVCFVDYQYFVMQPVLATGQVIAPSFLLFNVQNDE